MSDYLTNNPVGRLYKILLEVQKYPDNNIPLGRALADILGMNQRDEEEVIQAYLNLLRLFKRAREVVAQLPDIDATLYLKPFKQLEGKFTEHHLSAPVHTFKQHITEAVMMALQFCAHTASRFFGETEVPQEDLQKLREQVEALMDEVLSMQNFPREFRAFLLEHLDRIRRAVIYYHLHGVTSLREAFQTIVGSTIMWREEVKGVEIDEEEVERWRDILSKFFNVVRSLAEMIGREAVRALISNSMSSFLQLPPPS